MADAQGVQVGGAHLKLSASMEDLKKDLAKARQETLSAISSIGAQVSAAMQTAVGGKLGAIVGGQAGKAVGTYFGGTFGAAAGQKIGTEAGMFADTVVGKFTSAMGAVFKPVSDAIGASLFDFDRWIAKAISAESTAARFGILVRNMGSQIGYSDKQLQGMAGTMAAKGFSGFGEIRSAQMELMKLGNVTGDEFRRVMELSEGLAALSGDAMDMASAARMLGMALSNPEHGLRMLRHAGVLFSQDEKKLIEQFQKSGQDAQAHGVILDKVAKQTGGAVEIMAGTTKKQLDRLQRLWEGIGRSIGNALLPAVKAVADGAEPIIKSFSDIVSPTIRFVGSIIAEVVADARQFVQENAADFQAWASRVSDISFAALGRVKEAWASLKTFATSVWQEIAGSGIASWQGVKEFVQGALDAIALAIRQPGLAAQIAWTTVKLAAVNAFVKIIDFARDMAEKVPTWWEKMTAKIQPWISKLFTFLVQTASAAWDTIMEIQSGKFKESAKGIAKDFLNVIGNQLLPGSALYAPNWLGKVAEGKAPGNPMENFEGNLKDSWNRIVIGGAAASAGPGTQIADFFKNTGHGAVYDIIKGIQTALGGEQQIQLAAARKELNDLHDERLREKAGAEKKGEQGNGPGEAIATVGKAGEKVGLAALHDTIQKGIIGQDFAQQTAKNTSVTNEKLNRVIEEIGKIGLFRLA